MTKPKLTPLQVKILNNWNKTKVVHPSYGEVAEKTGCSVDTVFRTVKKYGKLTNSNAKKSK